MFFATQPKGFSTFPPSMGECKNIDKLHTDPAHKSQTACILFIYVYYKFYIHIITLGPELALFMR